VRQTCIEICTDLTNCDWMMQNCKFLVRVREIHVFVLESKDCGLKRGLEISLLSTLNHSIHVSGEIEIFIFRYIYHN
jgi:hypothetical protein